MERITNNPVYKQVLAGGFGGIMYNVANRNKYDSAELLAIWDGLTPGARWAAGDIVTGAINFLQGI